MAENNETARMSLDDVITNNPMGYTRSSECWNCYETRPGKATYCCGVFMCGECFADVGAPCECDLDED